MQASGTSSARQHVQPRLVEFCTCRWRGKIMFGIMVGRVSCMRMIR